jgi:hypothetical protein
MHVRRAAATLALTLAAMLGLTSTTAASAPAVSERSVAQRTVLTFRVADCEGCRFRLTQGISTLDADEPRIWSSRERRVEDGRVTFRPLTRRTHGLSVTVVAPWEGHTGYLTTVAWRYAGKSVGDPVTLEEAVTMTRASACWEGTRRKRLTIPVVVAEVEVDGVHERVPGSIAFVPSTRSWLPPMREVWDGVLGSQDVNICR